MSGRSPLDTTLSAPVVELLAKAGEAIPMRLRPTAASLIREHLSQVGESSNTALVGDIEMLASALLSWGRESDYSWRGDDVMASLLLSASTLDEPVEAFIIERARERPSDIGDLIEDPAIASVLARHRPELLLRLAGCYYLDRELFADPIQDTTVSPPRQRGVGSHLSRDEEDGVRDHSVRQSVVPLASPDRGPFLALLRGAPTLGLRLIGAVVDSATRARIRVEAQYGEHQDAVELDLGPDQRRTYIGTPHVWIWYRMHGVGAYPAMSALMALREWALETVSSEESLGRVVQSILGAGESLGLVAVALSIVIDNLSYGSAELDRFFSHPRIWSLEVNRHVQESSLLGPPLPEDSRLRLTPSEIAMSAVLAADPTRRERLRGVGQQLIARTQELISANTEPSPAALEQAKFQVTRWATELDIDAYRTEVVDEGIRIDVELPSQTREGLERGGGAQAGMALELHSLVRAAVLLRDDGGPFEGADVVGNWRRINQLIEVLGPEYDALPLRYLDALSASGSAILRYADVDHSVERSILRTAARLLVDVALAMPPLFEEIREMMWDAGADRSAAVGLPLLLNDELRSAAGVSQDDLKSALLRLAGSPLGEVRTRLADGLSREWEGAPNGEAGHELALEVLEELIASSGYGPWTNYGRPRSRLEPIPQALLDSEDIGNVVGMADAIPGLVRATGAGCEHSIRASEILEALIDYDEKMWPKYLARHHYSGHELWREQIDSVISHRALRGDSESLWRHVDAFRDIPEDLRGLLRQLAIGVETPEQAMTVNDLWPQLLDILLPQARVPATKGVVDRRPNHRDLEELDRALLFAPEQDNVEWPWRQTFELLVRWVAAFSGAPHVADRLIMVLARSGLLTRPEGTQLALAVLGTDAKRITRESSLVVAWLRFVLVEHPEAFQDRHPVRLLLDNLAALGDEAALALQQQIEA